MSYLPSVDTPLNQHSLKAIELWLSELGAQQSSTNPSLWISNMPRWSVEIQMERDELRVTWVKDGNRSRCCFPYGLSRQDVEVAIQAGP